MLQLNRTQQLPWHIELRHGLVFELGNWRWCVGWHTERGPQAAWLGGDGCRAVFTLLGGLGEDPIVFKVSLMLAMLGLELGLELHNLSTGIFLGPH